jgi:hypothetical protein
MASVLQPVQDQLPAPPFMFQHKTLAWLKKSSTLGGLPAALTHLGT